MSSGPAVRDVFNHILFECSTEVAHRVGGIYSVIKSKARYTTSQYGARYTLLGPWNRASVRSPFARMTNYPPNKLHRPQLKSKNSNQKTPPLPLPSSP